MEEKVARVALSAATYAIDRPYDYLIPRALEGALAPGMRVIVPFGAGNRRTEGIVLSTAPAPRTDKRLKSVLTLLDDTPVLDGEGIRLALWMRERWFCTVYDAARAMLPAGLYFSLQDRYVLAPGVDRERAWEAAGRSERARHIVELVLSHPGGAELRVIREAFGTKDPNPALRSLMDRGVLVLETSAARGVGDKREQMAVLAIPPEEALALTAAAGGLRPARSCLPRPGTRWSPASGFPCPPGP